MAGAAAVVLAGGRAGSTPRTGVAAGLAAEPGPRSRAPRWLRRRWRGARRAGARLLLCRHGLRCGRVAGATGLTPHHRPPRGPRCAGGPARALATPHPVWCGCASVAARPVRGAAGAGVSSTACTAPAVPGRRGTPAEVCLGSRPRPRRAVVARAVPTTPACAARASRLWHHCPPSRKACRPGRGGHACVCAWPGGTPGEPASAW